MKKLVRRQVRQLRSTFNLALVLWRRESLSHNISILRERINTLGAHNSQINQRTEDYCVSVTKRGYDIIPMHHNCRYPYDYRQKSFAAAGMAPF